MQKQREVLPLTARSAREDQRNNESGREGDTTSRAPQNRLSDADGSQSRTGPDAKGHVDVDRQVDEGEDEAAGEQEDLQNHLRREHALVPKGVEPLAFGYEPDDRARKDKDEERQPKQGGADPEAARRSWDPNLPRPLERATPFEWIKGSVAAAHVVGIRLATPVPAGLLHSRY